MTDELSSENHRPEVWALGPLPPPVTGMTLLTSKVVQGLRDRGPVTAASWSAGDAHPTPYTRAYRLLRAATCLARLVLNGRKKDGRLYLCCNTNEGLVMTRAFIKTAHCFGYKVFLHHHVYMYIDAFDRNMQAIGQLMGPGDVHLMHCQQMIDDFHVLYQSPAEYDFLFPSIASLPLGQPRRTVREPFRLGFLANLTIAKGLDLVLDTFRALQQRHRNVQLCLAGPCASTEAEQLVSGALKEFPGAVEHLGPVFDEQKVDFFNSIDCFVFPSRTEGWPIVLNEALDAGLPVIATNRGCVRTMVGDAAGLIVNNADHYVADAVRQVEAWIDSPQSYLATSEGAIRQADYLHRESDRQLEKIAALICSPTD